MRPNVQIGLDAMVKQLAVLRLYVQYRWYRGCQSLLSRDENLVPEIGHRDVGESEVARWSR